MNPTPAPPLVTDTTSATQAARARRKTRDRVKNDYALMRLQLSTYEGRQFVWRLLEQAGVFEDISGSDAAVREQIGRRRFGLALLADAGRHPELFNQMFQEGRARAETARKEAEAAREVEKATETQDT